MKKEELIQAHPELKLYDASNLIEMRNYKANLKHHQNEGNTTDHLKIIAPFGSDCFNADFYYFVNENEAISDVILRQMGFKDKVLELEECCLFFNNCELPIQLSIDDTAILTNIKTANQLHQLIQLLK